MSDLTLFDAPQPWDGFANYPEGLQLDDLWRFDTEHYKKRLEDASTDLFEEDIDILLIHKNHGRTVEQQIGTTLEAESSIMVRTQFSVTRVPSTDM